MLSIFMTEMAAMPAQFQRGFLLSFFPAPDMSEIETSPGWTLGSRRRVTKSPMPSTAQPRKSKPGPRLATVAGAKDLTEVKTGEGSLRE
uniref:Putative ovule protein n=1 Tax=Solanum chacoense TaxID=4108 RepID=A0A0V0H0N4_SOLCH